MVGERIRLARENQRVSLRHLAAHLAERGLVSTLSYTALHRIETGQRKVSSAELVELAEVLEVSVDVLLGRTERTFAFNLAARVAAMPTAESLGGVRDRIVEILEADDLLDRLVGPRPRPTYVPSKPTRSGLAGGRDLAALVRGDLSLGLAPIGDLTSVIEESTGALVFRHPLPRGTSGFCATGDGVSVIVVNADDSFGRQRFTLAHEFCHLLLADGDSTEVLPRAVPPSSGERRADTFASHFLAPERAVRLLAGTGPLRADDVVRLALRFGMSREAMANRVSDLKLPTTDNALQLAGTSSARLAELAGLGDEHALREEQRGRTVPSPAMTARVLDAYRSGQVGLSLVAAVTGIRDFDVLRDRLGDDHRPFEGAANLA